MMSGKKLTSFFTFSDDSVDTRSSISSSSSTVGEEEEVVQTKNEIPESGDRLIWNTAARFCGDLFNENDCNTLIKEGQGYYTRKGCRCDPTVPYCSRRCAWHECVDCLEDFCRYCVPLTKNRRCDACETKHSTIILSDTDTPQSPNLLSDDEESPCDESSLTLGSKDTGEESSDEESHHDESRLSSGESSEEENCQRLKRKIDRLMLENELLRKTLREETNERGNKRRKHCFYVKMIY